MDAVPFELQAAAIRERVGLQGFMTLVGAEIDELAPGQCTISVVRRPELLQQHGLFHGGVTAFLVDNGTTIAAATVAKPGQGMLTAEYKLNLVAPADGDRLICRCRVVKPGSRMTVVSAEVFTTTPKGEKQTAVALATIAVLDASTMPPLQKGA